MYLKKINIYAFKTFADRTELDFGPGVTAIVGPNGCGKSNIADAIAWVLGEQSARSLRGIRMDDVIFTGSAARKPLNMTEVTLVLDNSDGQIHLDYSEVGITRRLYRSGESEYLINKNTCRMKDVHDLLLDTGLGREAYAFITQGQVDAILSNKPEERRAFFEEAAGIQKYKYRKREALRKLEATQDNIVRLNDIVFEIERQLGPLESEAVRAADYTAWSEELSSSQLALFSRRVVRSEERLVQISEDTSRIEVEVRLREGKISRMEADIAAERLKIASQEDILDKMRLSMQDAVSQEERSRGNLRLACEKLSNAGSWRKELHKRASEAGEWMVRAAGEKAALEAVEQGLHQQAADVERELQDKESRMAPLATAMAEKRTLLEELQESSLGKAADMAGSRSLLDERRRNRQEIDRQVEEISTLLQEKRAAITETESCLAGIRRKAEENTRRVEAVHAEREAAANAVLDLETLYRNKLDNEAVLHRKLASLTSRREVLQEMLLNLEGYHQGARSVIGWHRDGDAPGVTGTVADVIDVPRQYEIAVETALGTSLQNIIVEDDAAARTLIARLKNAEGGRATFMPLNMIVSPDRSRYRRYTGRKGVVGRAADLVGFGKAYGQVVELLLGHVIVMQDIDSAIELAKQERDIRLVTLEGDFISPGGLISGGSRGGKRGLLGREREIAEIDEEMRGLESEAGQLRKTALELEAGIAAEKEKIRNLTLQASQAESERSELADKLRNEQWRLSSVRDEEKRLSEQLESAHLAGDALDTVIVKLQEQLHNIAGGSSDMETLRDQNRDRLSALMEEERILREETADLRLRAAGIRQRLETLRLRLADLAAETLDRESRIREAHEGAESAAQALAVASAEKESMESMTAAATAEVAELRASLDALRLERRRLETECLAAEDQVRQERRTVGELMERSHRLELQKARLEAERDGLCQRLREEYGIDYNECRDRIDTTRSEAALARRVEELRAMIDEMGPVNALAGQELLELKERYDALALQQTDLVSARETLLTAIDEIDKVSLGKFTSVFSEVGVIFKRIFTRLFGGGEADLCLIDESDPLSSGIEIVAMPPGKRKQSLSLLSGGERALTVLALLFAVLEVKPSPFCVLDEVEAALDEANVGRFGEVLREFTSHTQFLIITHNKGTMEIADTLFGVTMAEPGVSSIVSVRMTDGETGRE